MQYINIENQIVTEILCSSDELEGYKKVPDNHEILVGDDIRFFDEVLYTRLTTEEAEQKKLIETKPNTQAVWKNGWTVVSDYSKEKYWNKETKQPVEFKLGEVPNDSMTDIEPEDFQAEWINNSWVVSNDVLENRARNKRDELLRKSDFIMMSDYPISDKTSWEEYRQALRDIPNQKGFPTKIDWEEITTLRAVANGTATQNDTDKLLELETEAESLRKLFKKG